jgi:glycosyltransferase involved in cell wall biosynthesis
LPAYIVKKLVPQTRVVLLAHGIEIWDKISPLQKKMLGCCDEIVAVSQFTSDRIQAVHGFPASKCKVLNNCLDPFLSLPKNAVVTKAFYEKYHCSPEDRILFTLTRLAGTEHYKGYDIVLNAIKDIAVPGVRYLLAGKYDAVEKQKLDILINQLGLTNKVVLPGFVPDEDLAPLFTMADLYVMPSSKEGFGIVFIEAMYYGLPVIAGNADGSVDALFDGALGLLVNPHSVTEVKEAIEKILDNPARYKPDFALLQSGFSFEQYKRKIDVLLERHH